MLGMAQNPKKSTCLWMLNNTAYLQTNQYLYGSLLKLCLHKPHLSTKKWVDGMTKASQSTNDTATCKCSFAGLTENVLHKKHRFVNAGLETPTTKKQQV